MALVGISSGVAAGHIRYGSDIARSLDGDPAGAESCRRGGSREIPLIWFGVAGSAFAAIKELGRARPLLNKSFGVLPRSARAKTLLGTLKELRRVHRIPTTRRPYQYENVSTESGWRCFTRPDRITGKRCATTRTTHWPTFDWDTFFISLAGWGRLARRSSAA